MGSYQYSIENSAYCYIKKFIPHNYLRSLSEPRTFADSVKYPCESRQSSGVKAVALYD